ncbi:MAG: TonB family protein, partial [Bacteroidetes bacterium]|nr:TonB family protein [Bacteroidota bacterium]
EWEYWYENGQKKTVFLYDEEGEKVLNFWDEEGGKTVNNGEGTMVEHHENGQEKYRGQVTRFFRSGSWKTFYENGAKKEEVLFNEKGLASGVHQYWYPDGSLELWGMRKDGRKFGTWLYYNPEGKEEAKFMFSPEDLSEENPIYEMGERQPIPINMNQIKKLIGYPQSAYAKGQTGSVIMRVLVNPQGIVESYEAVEYEGLIFKKAVEDHIEKLRFVPAIYHFYHSEFWVNIPFNFAFR